MLVTGVCHEDSVLAIITLVRCYNRHAVRVNRKSERF